MRGLSPREWTVGIVNNRARLNGVVRLKCKGTREKTNEWNDGPSRLSSSIEIYWVASIIINSR